MPSPLPTVPDTSLLTLDSILDISVPATARLLRCVDRPIETWSKDERIRGRYAFQLYLIDELIKVAPYCQLPEAMLLTERMGPLLYDIENERLKGGRCKAVLSINRQCAIWTGLCQEVYNYYDCCMQPTGFEHQHRLAAMMVFDLQLLTDQFIWQLQRDK